MKGPPYKRRKPRKLKRDPSAGGTQAGLDIRPGGDYRRHLVGSKISRGFQELGVLPESTPRHRPAELVCETHPPDEHGHGTYNDCTDRAGVSREAHEYDRDERCIFCDYDQGATYVRGPDPVRWSFDPDDERASRRRGVNEAVNDTLRKWKERLLG